MSCAVVTALSSSQSGKQMLGEELDGNVTGPLCIGFLVQICKPFQSNVKQKCFLFCLLYQLTSSRLDQRFNEVTTLEL